MRIAVYMNDSHPELQQKVKVGGQVRDDRGRTVVDEDEREVPVLESGHLREGRPHFAFRYGRILDMTHPITAEPISRVEIADALEAQAREQFPPPHYEVVREDLEEREEPVIDAETGEQATHPETGEPLTDLVGVWVPVDQFNPERAAGAGTVRERAVTVEQGTDASAEA